MTELTFVMGRGQNHFFVELARALSAELAELGVSSRTSDRFPNPRTGEVCAVLPPHEFFALEGYRVRADPRVLRRTVLICAEQPGSHFFDLNVRLAQHAGAVFDIHSGSVRELARRGVRAGHLQLGWTSAWKAPTTPGERDVDALFLGAMSPRRLKHLASYADVLSDAQFEVVLSDNSRPNTLSSPGFIVDDEKWALLARARTLLNVHVDQRPYFEWLRIAQAIINGCPVVSEHSTGFAPLIPGEHFISGRPEALALLALELIDNDGLRTKIASSAEELLRTELPLRNAAMLLAQAVERLDQLPPVVSGGGVMHIDQGKPPVFRMHREVLGETRPERAIKDWRIVGMHLRRKAVELMSGRQAPHVERRSPGYTALEPRVSVIVALRDHAREVIGALESVRLSSYSSAEIVIVEDGSRDDSSEAVVQWMETHGSQACILIRHPVNRGLPSARNTALRFARGEYVFVLDADNALYPKGLKRLVSALDRSPRHAFAYGLLQQFDEHGPRGVLNIWPWQPERLQAANYIDAMALINRRTALELGGYTTDPRLFGWEDYDLWCKFAAAGASGLHVREFVGRYRVSSRSMIQTTNISTVRAFATLEKRHPRIMGAS